MLITLSGMVGSGKTTAATHVLAVLEAAQEPSEYVRFRSLTLFGAQRLRAESSGATRTPAMRWQGFTPKALTFPVACGYLARIIAFRMFGPSRKSARWNVLDRYFYDSFVHFELRSARERLYLGALRRVIPVPDISVVLIASDHTIARRRPDYAPEYVSAAGEKYRTLRRYFPELIEISADDAETVLDQLTALVRGRLNRLPAGARTASTESTT